jgi:hypothetical protein
MLRKPCPTRLTFLTSRFTASVGPLEQPPVAWKAGSRDSSGTWTTSWPSVEAVQGGVCRRRTDRSIDGPQQLLALPGGRHLTGRVTGGEPRPQPCPSSLSELLCGGEQQLADTVQGIWLAAPVAEGGLLDWSGHARFGDYRSGPGQHPYVETDSSV